MLGVTSTGTISDVPDSAATLSQVIIVAGRAYEFHEFGGDLKVSFRSSPTVDISSLQWSGQLKVTYSLSAP